MEGMRVPYHKGVLSMALADTIKPHLPYLRTYARALTGSQTGGAAYVRATLEAIIEDPQAMGNSATPRIQLHRTFHPVCETTNPDIIGSSGGGGGSTQAKLRKIAPM